MDINGLLNKFLGTGAKPDSNYGMAGGALAGGALALLMGNKGVRKLAGTAASVGGMALLGGMAVKAFQSWQNVNSRNQSSPGVPNQVEESIPQAFLPTQNGSDQLEMNIVKAMVAAAKADGHIDAVEQDKIFKQAQGYDFTSEEKALMFDLLSKPISLQEIVGSVTTMEHRAEIYLASRIACGADASEEQAYLVKLAEGLNLPQELVKQLDRQVTAQI